ncbi:MAG: hypothetical protein AAF228_01970 [Pseudomonadota bacterium]
MSLPLLIIPVLFYFIIAFYSGDMQSVLDSALIADVILRSGGIWKLTVGDVFILLTLLILFVEVLKATRVSTVSLIDHGLSTLLFVGCLISFIVVKEASTSTFFLITVMTLFDVIAGFSISLRAARRDIGFPAPT